MLLSPVSSAPTPTTAHPKRACARQDPRTCSLVAAEGFKSIPPPSVLPLLAARAAEGAPHARAVLHAAAAVCAEAYSRGCPRGLMVELVKELHTAGAASVDSLHSW